MSPGDLVLGFCTLSRSWRWGWVTKASALPEQLPCLVRQVQSQVARDSATLTTGTYQLEMGLSCSRVGVGCTLTTRLTGLWGRLRGRWRTDHLPPHHTTSSSGTASPTQGQTLLGCSRSSLVLSLLCVPRGRPDSCLPFQQATQLPRQHSCSDLHPRPHGRHCGTPRSAQEALWPQNQPSTTQAAPG